MKFVWAAATHPGRARSQNQDRVLPEKDGRTEKQLTAAVADGMGGHRAGNVASRIAMETIRGTSGKPARRIRAANRAIMEQVIANPQWAGMGTTLTLADINPAGKLVIGHVGDSRAYLLRDSELTLLTEDHTFVSHEVNAGRLTEDSARTHPRRGELIRVLGMGHYLDVDIYQHRLAPGDRLLLCSDGLTQMITDEELAPLLGSGSVSEAAWGLIEAANQAGGRDNISVVVISVSQ